MDTESRIDTYPTPLDAQLAKAFLESHGLAVRLEGEDIMGAAYALGPMMGGVRLYVDRSDGDRASQLLAEYHRLLRVEFPQTRESSDRRVERAWIAALVGLVTVPVVVNAYSVWLLLHIERRALAPRARNRYFVAWTLNVLALVVAVWLIHAAQGWSSWLMNLWQMRS